MLSRLKIRTRIVLVAIVQAVAFAGAVAVLGSGAPTERLGLAAGLALAGAVVAFALAGAVARTVTRPLRRLEDAAGRGTRLPNLVEALRRPTGRDHDLALTPVNLPGDDEIGRAGRAFDAFQGEAAKLAVSQATLLNKGVADKGTFEVFVNLARRMQSLVDHQIDLLDGLEAGEEDPDALENLFRLDHLATRVRRNAESLLTMAGAASSRSWERPLAIADVLRAGMAEVEDLARIDLEIEDEVAILGNVAADSAHLLSELLENATRWSPPDTRVRVVGRQRPGGYEIVVKDSGIGMAVEALTEANHILTGPPLAGATVARALGLVVAGRLARRLGIGVRLVAPETGGITAHVVLPDSLLVAAADAAEEMEAAGARTLPFALARQEKRARISSQRRRGPVGERRDEPPTEMARIISLPEPAAPAPEPTPSWEPPSWSARRTSDTWAPSAPTAPGDAAPPVDDVRPSLAQRRRSFEPPAPAPDEPDMWEPPAADETPAASSWTAEPAIGSWPTPEPAVDSWVTPQPAAAEADEAPAATGWAPRIPAPAPEPPAVEPEPEAPAPAVEPAAEAPEPEAPAPAVEPAAEAPKPLAASVEPPAPILPARRPPAAADAPAPVLPRPRLAVPSVEPPDIVTPPVRPSRFAAATDPAPPSDLPVRGTRADEFQRHLERATAAGLVRRVPKASLPADTGRGVQAPPVAAAPSEPGSVAGRLPEEVRSLLSSYRSGVRRGRLDDTADEYPTSQEGS